MVCAKQCKLIFFKLATGLWNTSFTMGTMGSLNACVMCEDHGVQGNKTTLDHVILKCLFLKGKVERLYATIPISDPVSSESLSNSAGSPNSKTLFCGSPPRGNFNIHENILLRELRESIREFNRRWSNILDPTRPFLTSKTHFNPHYQMTPKYH